MSRKRTPPGSALAAPGANRNNNSLASQLILNRLSTDDFNEIIDSLALEAMQRDVHAADLLFKYAFGPPSKAAAKDSGSEQIQIIEYQPTPDKPDDDKTKH